MATKLCQNNCLWSHVVRWSGFFLVIFGGGNQNFWSPSVANGDEVEWGELAKKNPTEAKTAHLMQN